MALPFIQALRRRLDPKRPSPGEPVIHIHEDDWGMRCLHPLAALDDIEADMDAADAASEANFDGVGWTDMYAIKPPEARFSDAGLTVDAVATVLAPLMPRVKRFNAGIMSSYDSPAKDAFGSYEAEAWCFGFDRDCFVKIEPRDGLVGSIWYEAATADPGQLATMRQALEAIDALAPACVADYWSGAVGPVGDVEFMDRYFDFLARNDEAV